MNKILIWLVTTSALVAGASLQSKSLPVDVQKTVQASAQGAEIKNISNFSLVSTINN